MSSTSTNLAFMIKSVVSQFISTKLKNAKSVKNNITNQQQNFNNIIDLFNMLDTSNLLNQASLNEASFNKISLSKSESSALYQYLDCSHINIQT